MGGMSTTEVRIRQLMFEKNWKELKNVLDGAKAAGENVPDKLMKAAQKIVDTPKVRIAGQTGKEAAKDIPSFARGEVPTVGETSADFARRKGQESMWVVSDPNQRNSSHFTGIDVTSSANVGAPG